MDSNFLWAVGIEDTFIPHVRPGLRALDEYALTQHYLAWKDDLDRAADTGASALRWGLPWYKVQPGPDAWDWGWADEVLDYAVNVKGLTVILDLIHYGTPLWLDNSFINSRYPECAAEYARAVAQRYGSLVRYYTPINEPVLNAHWCGRRAEWPPYLTGDDGFVKLILPIARGLVLTAQALRAEQPEAVLVQVEATHLYRTPDPALEALVAHHHEEQFLSWDLATGRVTPTHALYPFLLENGATEAGLDWFRANAVQFDIFGLNFYPWSYGVLAQRKDGRLFRRPGHTRGGALAEVVQAVHNRYGLPIMITETSSRGEVAARARWMDETVAAVCELRAAGLPVRGYTWFPLFAMIEWSYRTGRRPLPDYTLQLGLYDGAFDAEGVFHRQPTPLVERYRGYTQQWRTNGWQRDAGEQRAES